MKIAEIARVIEAVLFVSGDGVDRDEFKRIYDMSDKELNKCLDILKEKYSGDSGIHLIQYKNKMQLCSNPALADNIAEILNPIRERSLTKAALETVAIVAYKQPITRTEIEQIRGVNCDYAVQLLQNNNLIEVVGRKDAVGKPLLFGTTDNFLKRFELDSLDQLPNYKELLDRIRVIHSEGDSLYREFTIPEEERGNNSQEDAQANQEIEDGEFEQKVTEYNQLDNQGSDENLQNGIEIKESVKTKSKKKVNAEEMEVKQDLESEKSKAKREKKQPADSENKDIIQDNVSDVSKPKLSWKDKMKAKMAENSENYDNLDSVLEKKIKE